MIFNGSKLKALREAKPLSKLALAKKLGVSDPQVGRWEENKSTPRPATIKRICKVLGIAVSDLIVVEREDYSEAT